MYVCVSGGNMAGIPPVTRGNLKNCKKTCKKGLEHFRLIRGALRCFFMFEGIGES